MTASKPSSSSGSGTFAENVKTILYALALAMIIRFAIVQPFRIPSGSMQPTLLVGDYIIVTKWSYGYSKFSFAVAPIAIGPDGRMFGKEPRQGDVVVFRPANDPTRDFVKRLIGLPGDRIQMKDGALYINGEPVKRERISDTRFTDQSGNTTDIPTYVETLPSGVSYRTFDKEQFGQGDNTQVYEVPEGRYMMLGDDRDGSADSRLEVGGFGFVPFDHLVGKAQFVFVSFDHTTSVLKPWTLLTGFRGDRILHGVD